MVYAVPWNISPDGGQHSGGRKQCSRLQRRKLFYLTSMKYSNNDATRWQYWGFEFSESDTMNEALTLYQTWLHTLVFVSIILIFTVKREYSIKILAHLWVEYRVIILSLSLFIKNRVSRQWVSVTLFCCQAIKLFCSTPRSYCEFFFY